MSVDQNSRAVTFRRFRARLLVGMILLVLALTAIALFLAQHKVLTEVGINMQDDFQNEVADVHREQGWRDATLTELSRDLARSPRIHAALEDNALDVLYLSARDELRQIMREENDPSTAPTSSTLQAKFYRFLDDKGRVIPPPPNVGAGRLSIDEEAQLSLPHLPEKQQLGYIVRKGTASSPTVDEVIAIPIVSAESGELIAALVVGFETTANKSFDAAGTAGSGIFVQDQLALPGLSAPVISQLASNLEQVIASDARTGVGIPIQVAGEPCLLFYHQINPSSLFAPAYDVVIFPLRHALEQEHRLWWQVIGAGAALLFMGILASHFLAARLAVPVQKLEADSMENRAQRQRAEAALETTSAELQRAMRFSADASHQLKTPLTVLRAGLEDLLAQTDLRADRQEEVTALVHQTFRLTCIIEDLLLLSRMEAGRLQINFVPIDLAGILEALADDFTVLPEASKVHLEKDCPPLKIMGEKRYVSLILQNLLENAWKYNLPGGKIRIRCRAEGEWVAVTIANTGHPIPTASWESIFERFHRGSIGENIPGHGLGLNLARELARLHGGDLRLTRSDESWTEFEVRFLLCVPESGQSVQPADSPSQRSTADAVN